jgi:lipooligosaccharide transport system permease protein
VIFRFGMIPLFLFSGTFFPVTQLPAWIRPVAYATPLWHGVELCRALNSGAPDLLGAIGNIGYLAALAGISLAAGQLTYRRRLYV